MVSIHYKPAEDFTPDPVPVLESNRNLGYSLREAVADLIDNSISAAASVVELHLRWNEGEPYLTLTDNGKGMDKDTLVNAFKLGSSNPLEERDPDDLGRFGFGMKTASISQARCLTVASLDEGTETPVARALDLDFISGLAKPAWKLRHVDWEAVNFELPLGAKHGTLVRWDAWDRAPQEKNDFMQLTGELENYLALCFHRFIGQGQLTIINQGIKIKAVSPIPEHSQQYSTTPLPDYDCRQTAWTLQHPNYWEEDYSQSRQFNSYTLFEGLERQQGIYIYRCNRLLTPNGGWLGLVQPTNNAKLSRVVVDYPNNADHLWSLDITKTNAEIPYIFKKAIREFLEKSRLQSIGKVNRRAKMEERKIRGSIGDGLIWKQELNPELQCWQYRPNLRHAVFQHLIDENIISEKELKKIFELLSSNLPVAKIIENNDDDPGRHDRMSRNDKLTIVEKEVALSILQSAQKCTTRAEAMTALMEIEPWCYHEKELQQFFDERL